MSAPAWMKRLDGEGRVLAPLPAGKGGYGVYPGSDRRRRPMARASRSDVRSAVSDGLLDLTEGGYVLSEQGRGRLAREERISDQPFADQHRKPRPGTIMEPDGLRHVTLSDAPGPLSRYLKPVGGKPPLLSAVHAGAAALFVRDYERSALTSRVTADWSAPPGGKHRSVPADRADAPGSRLDAQARVLDALEAVGPGLDQLVFAVLIREVGMGQTEREHGWPERAGAAMLKMALERLAVHYRLMARPKSPVKSLVT